MRWLILTDDWPPQRGGVATWALGAAEGLAAAGCGVQVLARHRHGLEEPEGVAVTGVRGPSFGRRGPWWTALRALPLLGEVDAVLATTWPVARGIAPILAAAGIPLHIVAHGSELTRASPGDGLEQVWATAAGRWAVSRFLVGELAARGVRAQWIPSPVEVGEHPAEARPHGPWVLIARATELKGGERFVRVVAEAGVQAVVVGDGPALGSWKREAAERGARVRFTGALHRAQVREVLSGAAVVALFPGTDPQGGGAEGLGLALLEGAALGALAVGCAVGGVPEAVGTGLLVDPERPAEAAAAIHRALSGHRPALAWAQLAATHGRARVARALLG